MHTMLPPSLLPTLPITPNPQPLPSILIFARDAPTGALPMHHFLFDCPACSSIELVMPIIFMVLVQYLTFLTIVKQMHVLDSLGTVFP